MRNPYNRPLHPRHLRPAGREKTGGQLSRRPRDGAPVPRPELPGWQAVEGRLVLTPRKDFEGQAVRLKLVRQEVVLRYEGNLDEPIEAKETVAESPGFGPECPKSTPSGSRSRKSWRVLAYSGIHDCCPDS
jgi:hypothetical protein